MIHALIVCLVVSTNEAKHRRLFEECLLEKDTIIYERSDKRLYVKVATLVQSEFDDSRSVANVTYCLHPDGPISNVVEPTTVMCSRCMSDEELASSDEALKLIARLALVWMFLMVLACSVCVYKKRDKLFEDRKTDE